MHDTQLIEEIDRFIAETGMAESTFARQAVNDPSFINRLRRDPLGVTFRTAKRVREFMDRERERRQAAKPSAEEARAQ